VERKEARGEEGGREGPVKSVKPRTCKVASPPLDRLRRSDKCVSGCLAGTVLICLEIFRHSLEYARSDLPDRIPADAEQRFGASFGVAWASLAIYVAVGVSMFLLSGKRKGERAYTDKEATENEPVHLGRI